MEHRNYSNMAATVKLMKFILMYCLIYFHARSADIARSEDYEEEIHEKQSIFTSGLHQLHNRYRNLVTQKCASGLAKIARGKPKFSTKTMIFLLLLMCGDIESNPGPQCNDCKLSQGKICQGDLVLCENCEMVRFPPKARRQERTEHKGKIDKGKTSMADIIVITDQESIITNYKLDIGLQMPPEHVSKQKDKFEGVIPYLIETTSYNHLPALILATYHIVYQGLGSDDKFFVNWTDLVEAESRCDEIKIVVEKVEKSDVKKEWIEIFIHFPTCSITTTGSGLKEFANTFLPKILQEQKEILNGQNYDQQCEGAVSNQPIDPPSQTGQWVTSNTANSKSKQNTNARSKQNTSQKVKIAPTAEIDLTTTSSQESQTNLKDSTQKTCMGLINNNEAMAKPEKLENVWRAIQELKQQFKNLNPVQCIEDLLEKERKRSDDLIRENENLKQKIIELEKLIATNKRSTVKESYPAQNIHAHNNQYQSYQHMNPISQSLTQSYPRPVQFYQPPPLQSYPLLQSQQLQSQQSTRSSLHQYQPDLVRHQHPFHQSTTSQSIDKETNAATSIRAKNPSQYQNTATSNMSTNQQSKLKDTENVILLGDSMVKDIQGHKLSRRKKVKTISISGATSEDFKDYIRPLAKKKPSEIIIHCGTNDLLDKNIDTVNNIKDIAAIIKQESPNTNVSISSITYRADNESLNTKIDIVNTGLLNLCKLNRLKFVDNSNISLSELNGSLLHLNKSGTIMLARNFIEHFHRK